MILYLNIPFIIKLIFSICPFSEIMIDKIVLHMQFMCINLEYYKQFFFKFKWKIKKHIPFS